MTPELFRELERSGGAVDLSDRAKLVLRGADRVRYLNGQVTQDVRKSHEGASALRACITNAKGRMEGDVFIHTPRGGETLCLDAESVLRETLQARLNRYMVADDVELGDVSDQLRLWHFFGNAAIMVTQVPLAEGGYIVPSNRLGEPGVDLWLSKEHELPRMDCLEISADDLETFRILRGIPRWPNELNGEVFPQEAGLEAGAMDFSKGCYIGQEVLSRIKTTGKMPRVLVKWTLRNEATLPSAPPVLPRLLSADATGGYKEIGHVTSACAHPLLDRGVGLGYVRQGFEAAHSLLLAFADEPTIHHEVEIIRI